MYNYVCMNDKIEGSARHFAYGTQNRSLLVYIGVHIAILEFI
jgi:hypothetical protein